MAFPRNGVSALPPPPPAPLQPVASTVLTGSGDDYYARRGQAFQDWGKDASEEELTNTMADMKQQIAIMKGRVGTGEGEMFPMDDAEKRTKSALLAEQEARAGQPDRQDALLEALRRARARTQRGI